LSQGRDVCHGAERAKPIMHVSPATLKASATSRMPVLGKPLTVP
jgi:hypothetical protein